MTMDRFMSRRGRPQKIVSDNGGNFVRANMVIAEEINAWNQRQVEEFLLQKGVAWKFNPPYASHFGGIWERHIRTIRKLLFHLLSSQSITDEVLCTVFCQVEWIINYRPITRVNDDAEVLRPIDLLIPLRPNSGPISIVGDQKSTEVVWRQAKNLVEQFWRKWIKLYVQYLQERSKWLKKETNVRVGDIVLVCDLNVRRREWPLGKVSRVIFGGDNLVRSVEILVCGKQILRPMFCCLNYINKWVPVCLASLPLLVNHWSTLNYARQVTDGISPKILKETVEQISTPLAHVFNMSLQEGIVPLEWKVANIVPLFKKGSRNKSVNYRPVSLTSVICKLLETIIRDHMMDFLVKHTLINPSQHGFLKARSCLTNLLCYR